MYNTTSSLIIEKFSEHFAAGMADCFWVLFTACTGAFIIRYIINSYEKKPRNTPRPPSSKHISPSSGPTPAPAPPPPPPPSVPIPFPATIPHKFSEPQNMYQQPVVYPYCYYMI